ncbi:hypothetical protein G9P44_000759 [Scheffersomyces stipitis]|nr:hypothetical protein G9P44_000759 [Scheffersomyces stipitis]
MSKTTVFLSGATGYIAQQIIVELLSKGYNVVGSVRSQEKGEKLKSYYGEHFQYVVVPNLEQKGVFDEALKKHPEVTVFIHTASPATFSPEDNERDTLIPAIDGTVNALQGIVDHAPQIKRVVLTGSTVSTVDIADFTDPTFFMNENSWAKVTYEDGKTKDGLTAYWASKKYAEKAAWEFVESKKPNFTISTILPAYVFGPQAQDAEAKGQLNLTAEIVGGFYRLSKDDKVPEVAGPFVDVRDVAKAHVIAFEKDEAQGQRIITSNGRFSSQLILNIIRDKFPELREKLPVGVPANGKVPESDSWDDSKSKKLLGFKFSDIEKVVVDTIEQVIRANE